MPFVLKVLRIDLGKTWYASILLQVSAAFDVLNNAVASRITDLGPTVAGFLNKLHQLVFKINGLNALTTNEEMFIRKLGL